MLFSGGTKSNKISAVGSGLVDFLIYSDDNFIANIGVDKGGMTLVNMSTIDRILEKALVDPIVVPGGAACNTIVGLAQLGAPAVFIGKLGVDTVGEFFRNALLERNVKSCLFNSELPTGRVLSIISPDAQRTMLTFLGASSEIYPSEITPKHFEGSRFVHIEGYLLFNPELMFAILESAKISGSLVCLDLASFTVVNESIEILNELIPRYVDILVGNEDEAKAYTGHEDERLALEGMAEHVKIAALKLGCRGSYISCCNTVLDIQPFTIGSAIDTTGAGDLWASGFLFGLLNRFSLEKCGRIASICGAEVCKVVGADIPAEGWRKISAMVSKL